MILRGDFAAGMRKFEPDDIELWGRNFAGELNWTVGNFASQGLFVFRDGSFGDVDAVQKQGATGVPLRGSP